MEILQNIKLIVLEICMERLRLIVYLSDHNHYPGSRGSLRGERNEPLEPGYTAMFYCFVNFLIYDICAISSIYTTLDFWYRTTFFILVLPR
jgi:hypothetical protein